MVNRKLDWVVSAFVMLLLLSGLCGCTAHSENEVVQHMNKTWDSLDILTFRMSQLQESSPERGFNYIVYSTIELTEQEMYRKSLKILGRVADEQSLIVRVVCNGENSGYETVLDEAGDTIVLRQQKEHTKYLPLIMGNFCWIVRKPSGRIIVIAPDGLNSRKGTHLKVFPFNDPTKTLDSIIAWPLTGSIRAYSIHRKEWIENSVTFNPYYRYPYPFEARITYWCKEKSGELILTWNPQKCSDGDYEAYFHYPDEHRIRQLIEFLCRAHNADALQVGFRMLKLNSDGSLMDSATRAQRNEYREKYIQWDIERLKQESLHK